MLHIVLQNKTEQNNPPPELAFLNLLYDQEKPPTLLYFFLCAEMVAHIFAAFCHNTMYGR